MDPEKTLGRYKVTATLGKGEMGTVYLAEDPAIGRRVAIKTLRRPPDGSGQAEDDARARFDREVRVTGTFTHPNIVTVYDVGLEEEEAFIAMAYVDGGSLRSLMAAAERPLPFDRVVELVKQIASGLDYAHKNGVVHRDIKPANILLTAEGAPMVSDFGVARMPDSKLTRQGEACGSPSYMSPEQATSQDVTGASDQFSLAIITYEMLTGELPFAGQSVATVLYQVVHTDPVPPQRVNPLLPAAAGEVVMRAMSKHPGERYPTCTAYAHALAEALAVAQAASRSAPSASTPAHLAATVHTKVHPPGQQTGGLSGAALRLRATINSARVLAGRWLQPRDKSDSADGGAAHDSRPMSAYLRPSLIGATIVIVLAVGMWLGNGWMGAGATEEVAPPRPATGDATAAEPSVTFPLPVTTSPPAEGETEPGTGELLMRPAASDAELPQAGAETTETTGQEPAVEPPAPEPPAAAADEPDSDSPVTSPSATDEAAAAEPVVSEPAPATTEDPGVVATDPEEPLDEAVAPEARWSIVAAGTIPEKFAERASNAATVIDEVSSAPETGIPSSLLQQAGCVAVIPNVRKVGFIIGTTYGRGVVSCRIDGGWSRPSFLSIGGGGFKIGAQSTDFVLVFVNQAAADRLLQDKFELGTDVPVSAGPVGQSVDDAPETTQPPEIYAYARSDGTFEGAALEGTDVEIDKDANEDVYGRGIGPQELLLSNSGELPEELAAFLRILAAAVGG